MPTEKLEECCSEEIDTHHCTNIESELLCRMHVHEEVRGNSADENVERDNDGDDVERCS